jgi:hypothetical protein
MLYNDYNRNRGILDFLSEYDNNIPYRPYQEPQVNIPYRPYEDSQMNIDESQFIDHLADLNSPRVPYPVGESETDIPYRPNYNPNEYKQRTNNQKQLIDELLANESIDIPYQRTDIPYRPNNDQVNKFKPKYFENEDYKITAYNPITGEMQAPDIIGDINNTDKNLIDSTRTKIKFKKPLNIEAYLSDKKLNNQMQNFSLDDLEKRVSEGKVTEKDIENISRYPALAGFFRDMSDIYRGDKIGGHAENYGRRLQEYNEKIRKQKFSEDFKEDQFKEAKRQFDETLDFKYWASLQKEKFKKDSRSDYLKKLGVSAKDYNKSAREDLKSFMSHKPVQDYLFTGTNIKRIVANFNKKTGEADLDAIYGFIHTLDPNAVREGEVQNLKHAISWFEKREREGKDKPEYVDMMKSIKEKLKVSAGTEGRLLKDNQRSKIIETMLGILKSRRPNYKNIRNTYEDRIKAVYGPHVKLNIHLLDDEDFTKGVEKYLPKREKLPRLPLPVPDTDKGKFRQKLRFKYDIPRIDEDPKQGYEPYIPDS